MVRADVKVTVGIPTRNRANFLRESIASVLAQSYTDFRLLVCDNASDDDTEQMVASFDDSRIEFARSDRDIGMPANFNRVYELAETEYVLLLPDDDLIYPDHLRRTVEVLDRFPSVGVVHTAFDRIDGASRVFDAGKSLVEVKGSMTIESGTDFLERSMRSAWTVCAPSAIARTRAILAVGAIHPEEQPFADIPMWMRIARDWDFAALSSTLAANRAHAEAETTNVLCSGSEAADDLLDRQLRILYEHRIRFLEEGGLPAKQVDHYRALAERTLRRDRIGRLVARAGSQDSWMSTSRALAHLVRTEPRNMLLPVTWRLCAEQLGGRQVERAARRFLQPQQ